LSSLETPIVNNKPHNVKSEGKLSNVKIIIDTFFQSNNGEIKEEEIEKNDDEFTLQYTNN
jgi:hypothetical protein